VFPVVTRRLQVVDCVDSGQRDRILRLALDGLRYQPSDA
jgi:hypothetical protein